MVIIVQKDKEALFPLQLVEKWSFSILEYIIEYSLVLSVLSCSN